MEESILNQLGIDPLYIILGQAVLTIILMIIVLVCIFKIKKLYRSYDYFMRGKDAETLEDIIIGHIQDIQELKSQDRANKDQIRINNKNMRASFQRFGMVKYNALLDYTNTGFILNSVHSREGCYLYLKLVDRGQTEISLGNEEKEALEQALGYKELRNN